MLLASQHEMLRDTVRAFALKELAPNAARWDKENHFPREALRALGAMGLYAVAVPEEWGGAGMDYTALALAIEEISAGDGATSTIISVTNLVAGILNGFGSAAQKEAFLRPLAKGDLLGAFCLTEPHTGSDAAANLLGEEGLGYRIALANLESGRINIAAQAVGMARAALDAAVAYAKERKTFGQALIEHQAVNFRLADAATQIEAARQLYLHAAALRDAGRPCLKEASMAKLFASEMAEIVCSDAIQVHGGYGYVADFPVERIWRDVRVCKIYEGASDIQRLVIGRALAG